MEVANTPQREPCMFRNGVRVDELFEIGNEHDLVVSVLERDELLDAEDRTILPGCACSPGDGDRAPPARELYAGSRCISQHLPDTSLSASPRRPDRPALSCRRGPCPRRCLSRDDA